MIATATATTSARRMATLGCCCSVLRVHVCIRTAGSAGVVLGAVFVCEVCAYGAVFALLCLKRWSGPNTMLLLLLSSLAALVL